MKIQQDILEFRITTISLIKPIIYPTLMVVLIILLFVPLIIGSFHKAEAKAILIVSSSICCFIIIPNIILHKNYYKHDKGKKLIINKMKKLLIITINEQTLEIPFNEIEYIEELSTIFFRIPTSYYCYCLNLKNRNQIYLSNLLVQRLEKELPEISFDQMECFFPYIKNN